MTMKLKSKKEELAFAQGAAFLNKFFNSFVRDKDFITNLNLL